MVFVTTRHLYSTCSVDGRRLRENVNEPSKNPVQRILPLPHFFLSIVLLSKSISTSSAGSVTSVLKPPVSSHAHRDVLVRFAAHLCLHHQRPRRVVHLHEHLHELDLVRLRERLVVQEVGELGFGLDGVRLACLALDAAERGEKRCPVPASGPNA